MKVFHYINFGLIFLFLIAICVVEEVVVSHSLRQTQHDCLRIEQQLEQVETINNMEMAMLVEDLEYHWNRNESHLCYLVNHKSIEGIGQEISKMKSYVHTADADALRVSVQTIQYYCHSYLHFMGANVHNIL